MDFVLYLGQPQRGVKIAEPAFALLQLRLQQINGIAVMFVAFAALFELGLEKILLIAI